MGRIGLTGLMSMGEIGLTVIVSRQSEWMSETVNDLVDGICMCISTADAEK